MEITEELRAQLDRLNERQREAVEHVDGPLLVVAGPGTGKTQLLSLRAANILATRDVQAGNILCLTYTEAGAEAMRKRLVELIGREAYGIEVCTFHGFASGLRSRFPEYFSRGASATLVSEMRKQELVNGLLNALPASSPLFAGGQDGVNANLRSVMGFIGRFKQSGLSSDEFRAIVRQTAGFLDHAAQNTELLDLAATNVPRKAAEKEEFCARFEAEVERACALAPAPLRDPVVQTPGIYIPYAAWLRDTVRATELVDGAGKTAGLSDLKKLLFEGTNKDGRTFKDRRVCDKALAVIDVFDGYARALRERDLYDFDDMITDAIDAMRASAELRQKLTDRYRYIQVDEFQDTNGSQLRIVELLCGGVERPNVMAVGDDDQAIMRFQGASVACIEQFQDRYRPHNVVLKVNYRSTPAIVDMGKGIADQIETRLPASAQDKDIAAFRQASEQVEFEERACASPEAEYFELARDIRARIDEGFIASCDDADEAIAVIAPKHKSLKALIPYLRHFNVPFSYRYTSELFQMESMQTLLALLRFVAAYAAGREAAAEAWLPQIIAAPELGVDHETCVRFALHARRNHHGRWMAALGDFGNRRLQRLRESLVEWAGQAPSAPVRGLIHGIARPLMAYYRSRSADEPLALAEFNGGIRALLRFVEGELGDARQLGRALRLADVVSRLDEARTYGVQIDASIALGKPGAVRLTSAHSSKGLEFDLVYLLDSDDGTWRGSAAGASFYPSNLLIGDSRDEDDVRRLLFVAVTRAKRRLVVYRAGTVVVRELSGALRPCAMEQEPEELAEVMEVSWRDSFALDTPELRALLEPDLAGMALSASALNDFVEYREGCANSLEFPAKRMMRLPDAPSIILEFGTTVHAFLEDYVNRVVKAGDGDVAGLVARWRRRVELMDFPPRDVAAYLGRFDRVAGVFLPGLPERLSGRPVAEARVSALTGSGVPLFGMCDLLLVDDEARTVRVVDYKTGFNYPGATPTTAYLRQLQFYKLLIESSPEYAGYTVTGGVDWYVEPEKGTAGTLHDPVEATATGGEIAHLERLIDAVWRRIQEGRFDTGGFEQSPQYLDAVARNVTKDGNPRKHPDRRLFQAAYEDWLIAQG